VYQAVERLCIDLQPHLCGPVAFFGHSLGALLAFELARRLYAQHRTQPVHLFLSGQPAPHLPPSYPPIFHLGDRQFVEAIRNRYNGIPDEALQSGELMQLLLRPLRADFAMSDTYRYLPGEQLSCPITCYGGLEDREAGPAQLGAWREHTTGQFSVCMFPGDHFFIQSAKPAFLRTLSGELMRSL
jgi:medium-chain acyl-[acyl-carrier-protein] hydrolase